MPQIWNKENIQVLYSNVWTTSENPCTPKKIPFLQLFKKVRCGLIQSVHQSINQSANQFIGVIVWDRGALSIRAGGSCIKHMTKIIINNNTIHENNNYIKKVTNIKGNNRNYYIPECICKKYSSNTLFACYLLNKKLWKSHW